MKEAFRDLIEWERLCGRPLPATGPFVPSEAKRTLCWRLINEEVSEELLPALAGSPVEDEAQYLADVADACIDSIWVLLDCMFEHGMDPVAIWDEVRRTNFAKFGPGAWVRDDGKRMKPTNWSPPGIIGILASQRPLAEQYHRTGFNPPVESDPAKFYAGFLADLAFGKDKGPESNP